MSSPTPSLTVRNVRLPPAAYRALSLDTNAAPLVDLEYTASNDAVEVHLTPHDTSVEERFDPARPFVSTIRTDPTDSGHQVVAEEAGQRRLVGRFPARTTTPTPAAAPRCIDARGSLGIPGGLCHPHIHLDKCFLLDRCPLSSGTFDEALTATSRAKAEFTHDDLVARGRRLIAASLSHGVTSMRAFVEVDPTVGLRCVEAGIALQIEFAGRCRVQLVAFAQDPLFYRDEAKQKHMHELMRQAATREEVDVVGSAPYVESADDAVKQKEKQRRNVEFVFDLAREHGKHVDFHLDYDLDPPGLAAEGKEAMLPYVLTLARDSNWSVQGQARRVTIGHCTKLSVYTESDIAQLRGGVEGVSVVALPPSDMYMQGRDQPYASRSRATLPLLELQSLPMNWAMGVNNVANLFTPQGDADPLAMLPCMVGVWQSAKPHDCETLLAAISTSARYAAGFDSSYTHGEVWSDLTLLDGARGVQDSVCAPPFGRTTIARGRVVAHRTIHSTLF